MRKFKDTAWYTRNLVSIPQHYGPEHRMEGTDLRVQRSLQTLVGLLDYRKLLYFYSANIELNLKTAIGGETTNKWKTNKHVKRGTSNCQLIVKFSQKELFNKCLKPVTFFLQECWKYLGEKKKSMKKIFLQVCRKGLFLRKHLQFLCNGFGISKAKVRFFFQCFQPRLPKRYKQTISIYLVNCCAGGWWGKLSGCQEKY